MDGQTYNALEEGCRLASYDDYDGRTLAVGDTPIGTCTISVGVTGPDIVPGLIITQAQSDQMYAQRWLIAQQDAAQLIGAACYSELDEVRKAAVTSQAYNLGLTRFARFVNQLYAIKAGDWKTAAAECLNSEAAKELPPRYGRLAAMYESGQWQPGYGA